MSDSPSKAPNPPALQPSNLPTFQPSDLTAALLDILTSLPPDSKIELTKLASGAVMIAVDDPKKTKAGLIEEKYADLKGVGITISAAADKYGVPRTTVEDWVYRTCDVGFVDETAYPRLVDEAEVAVCADIYHARQQTGLTGLPYFDDQGRLIEAVKHPARSARRQRRKLAA